ncbi:MAG: nicotinate-nucleotide adenylyltransferase [candidate division WOR-3 bacterium]|nr:nicotinate-nucleotide adenylyltransferase [candidate division WOR-3 bacterium]MCX7757881.1 nicotinate-nucleotide adenylyltransferase [candidate division WOR-3 bacterium]MDW7987677.1 nicotinate-nucleotide adenylyltransferase [candidate division WOR-3 bacterium]
MKLGIFGGAFDPIHLGHLIIAEEVREILQLDKILFIPTYNPPHKKCVASYEDRCNMVKLAISDNSFFELCEIEKNTVTSWTIDTLKNLKKIYPHDELYLIIGTDQYQALSSWKSPEELKNYARLVVIPRPGTVEAPKANNQVVYLTTSLIDIASKKIRDDLKNNRSVKYKVTDNVLEYIKQNKLYN